MSQKQIVFVVTANKFGMSDSHHYVVGVYSTREKAEFHSDVETSWRGGHYSCIIDEIEIDAPIDEDALSYHYECFPDKKVI